MKRFALGLSLMCMLVAPVSAAKLYQWVDGKGRITYQDRPPPSGVDNYEVRDMQVVESDAAEGSQSVPVVMYTVQNCPSCEEVRAYLQRHNVRVTFKDPEQEQSVATEMQERFGRVEVPIVLIGEKELIGVNVPWLSSELKSAGIGADPGG